MIQELGWYEMTRADILGLDVMNPPLALTPLIAHIPHAVPVVIVWGIMLRFYFAQRKLKHGPAPSAGSPDDGGTAQRPSVRRVWAVDDTPVASVTSDRDEVPAVERMPTGRH
jgi:hypothetical protein